MLPGLGTPSPRDFDVTAKMAPVTSLVCDYGGCEGPKMEAEVKMAAPIRTRKSLTNDPKLKALWRSLAPLTFVAVRPLRVQERLGVCLIKLPTPRGRRSESRERFGSRGGPRRPAQREARSAGPRGSCYRAGGSHSSLALGVLGDL